MIGSLDIVNGMNRSSICSYEIGRIAVVVGVGICVACVVQHGIDHHHHRFVVDRQRFFRKLQ